MIGGADQDQFILTEWNPPKLGFVGGIGDDPEVNRTVGDILVDFIRPALFDLDLYFRIAFEKLFDVGSQLIQPYAVNGRQPD